MSESVKGILLASVAGVMFCAAIVFLMMEINYLKSADAVYRVQDEVVREYGGDMP